MFQVRIQARTGTPTSRPERDPETGAEEEPVEQDELLDRNTAVEQSDWL